MVSIILMYFRLRIEVAVRMNAQKCLSGEINSFKVEFANTRSHNAAIVRKAYSAASEYMLKVKTRIVEDGLELEFRPKYNNNLYPVTRLGYIGTLNLQALPQCSQTIGPGVYATRVPKIKDLHHVVQRSIPKHLRVDAVLLLPTRKGILAHILLTTDLVR